MMMMMMIKIIFILSLFHNSILAKIFKFIYFPYPTCIFDPNFPPNSSIYPLNPTPFIHSYHLSILLLFNLSFFSLNEIVSRQLDQLIENISTKLWQQLLGVKIVLKN